MLFLDPLGNNCRGLYAKRVVYIHSNFKQLAVVLCVFVCVCFIILENYVKEAKRVICLGYIFNEDSASKEPLRGLPFTNVY